MFMNKTTQTKPSREEIAVQAYCLWQKDGCKKGRDLDYWLAAEKQLQRQSPASPQQRPVEIVHPAAMQGRETKPNHLLHAGDGRQVESARPRS
jgi:hypothetical protein